MGFSGEHKAAGKESIIQFQNGCDRYQAIGRISEAITACREPEELARTLADEIGKFLQLYHLQFVVLKENSVGIEYQYGQEPTSFHVPLQQVTRRSSGRKV